MRDLPEVTAAPCVECPWRRESTPGHLGPHSAEEWALGAHGESAIACHMTIKRPIEAEWDDPGLRQCKGAAIFRANVLKLPRDPAIAVGPRDTDKVFSNNAEFITHHKEKKEK